MRSPVTPELSTSANIASAVSGGAGRNPERVALWVPRRSGRGSSGADRALSFRHLDEDSDRYAHGLLKLGAGRGCRVLLMVPPGAEFVTLAFALFKIGAVVVLIDPGMGKKNLLQCVREVEPEALVGVPLAHLLRLVYPSHFKRLKCAVTLGRRWLWGGKTLDQVRERVWRKFPMAELGGEEPVAIVFTTGSTGVPKGVPYRHAMLKAHIESIQSQFRIEEEEVGLAGFAPFALFSVAMGTTCVLPYMDPTRAAEVDPRGVIRSIRDHRVTYSFGSPAFWERVGEYCVEHQVQLSTMKKIVMAGAPVPERVLRQAAAILPAGSETHTPYGATEALPVTSITGTEVLNETVELTRQGAGICVGRALPGVVLKIIRIADEAINGWDEDLALPPREIGEIIVRGAVVTTEYCGREGETARAKIRQGDIVWHRMGDLGYLDELGRLWFCGRKSHRVITPRRTLFPVQCEAIFDCHADVLRSALVGVGPVPGQRPVIIIEPRRGRMPGRARDRAKFVEELLDLGRRNPLTRDITEVLFHPGFPVDFRHNAKILREELALWAEAKIRGSAGSLRPEAQGSKAPWRGK